MARLLNMSLGGGVFIAVILLVRVVSVNRLPKRAFLALWAAAFVRLMAPVHIPSPVSVYSAAQRLAASARPGGLLLEGPPALPEAAARAGSISPLFAVWLAGAALLALFFLRAHLRGRAKYRTSLPVENRLVQDYLERRRLRRPVQVRYSDRIESPLTYGILYPVILLPKGFERMGNERLAFVLSHELCHIRRFHVLVKWLLSAMLCVHWFNPLAVAMYLLANRDLELSCDESVVRSHGMKARSAYALALVELEEGRTYFTPLESGFSQNTLKERVTAIMKTHPPTFLRVFAAFALVCALTAVFATSAPAESIPRAAAGGASMPVRDLAAEYDAVNVIEEGNDGRISASGGYTQAQYDRLLVALKPDGYARMSIADFNRSVNRALSGDEGNAEGLFWIYDQVLSGMPDDEPNAAFLRNTVQASMNEYNARLSEVYEGKRTDPAFGASAQAVRTADIFGEEVIAGLCYADYGFTYRILDQDKLTVSERDDFLQQVMRAAQGFCEECVDAPAGEAELKKALEAAGRAASNEKITFTGCTIYGIENE